MMLAGGTKLGTYEVTRHIGSGGMGEVYQAHDTKLGRAVAVKVLPDQFARDPERLARFQREAKLLAALNHPNIATIHGLEQSGSTHYLVMELVPGETLRDRIAREGAVPVEEALTIAKQIAEALEAAHGSEKVVIHRDLKPANVKVTPEGRVKVLDFGLAKAFASEPTSEEIGNSPTLSMAATVHGVILGTAAYMSPEQARGKPVNKATDIWAFGAVLYELLAGKQAFEGEDVTDVFAAVVRAEPDWSRLPQDTSPSIRTLLKRCLRKDRHQRLQDATGVRIEIEDSLSGVASPLAEPPPAARVKSHERLTQIALAATSLIAITFAIGFVLRAPEPPHQPPMVRLSAEVGTDASLYTIFGPAAILSPDGTRVAFVAADSDQRRRIYVRPLDQLQATALSGTENARNLFFSPDGLWLGFFADGRLKKISVQGGAAVTLCDAPTDRGGTWGDDGTIVFALAGSGLSRVSLAGGTPQPLATLDKQASEISQAWPQMLPGSQTVLFTSNTSSTQYNLAEIVAYSMSSGERKTLHRGGFHARYLPTGHMVYMHEGTLFAVLFDPQRLVVTGQPVPLLEGVLATPGNGGAQFSFSDSGNLVYVAGLAEEQQLSLYWMDQDGKFTPLRETPGGYANPRFSPDGKRLLLQINDGTRSDIWVYEWERDTLTRLTFAGESNSHAVWTPDGQRITYSSQQKGETLNIWWTRSDGTGNPQRLTESKNLQLARPWHPDGKILTFRQDNPGTFIDIMTLAIEGDEKSGWKSGEPKPFLNSAFSENYPIFSPDGRWLAYMSNESGGQEVYVRPFPGPGGKWQISSGGGNPRWSRNGRELFYRAADSRVMVVTYTATGDSFRADKPQLWSPGLGYIAPSGISTYDLHPDGKRFAVLKATGTEETADVNKINVVLNWFEELKRRVPPERN